MKIKGLDELTKKLDDLASNAEKLHGTHQVPVQDVLTPAFVAKHTRFANVDEMFDASLFNIQTSADLAAVPDAEWDAFISSVSPFSTWQAMTTAAAREWSIAKLGL